MKMLKDVRYALGVNDGFYHYGRKIEGLTSIAIAPGSVVVTITLDRTMLNDEAYINPVSMEDFIAANVAGIELNTWKYDDLNTTLWGFEEMTMTPLVTIAVNSTYEITATDDADSVFEATTAGVADVTPEG